MGLDNQVHISWNFHPLNPLVFHAEDHDMVGHTAYLESGALYIRFERCTQRMQGILRDWSR